MCWSHDGRSLAVGCSSGLSMWTIPDPQDPPTNRELTESARRRSISHRLQEVIVNARQSKESFNESHVDNATRVSTIRRKLAAVVTVPEMLTLAEVPLSSAYEYRLRAEIFEKLQEPEKAAADLAEANRLDPLSDPRRARLE